MYGYIFEITNTKTGKTYLGKRYAVNFDKNYLGEDEDNAIAFAVEKYGKASFSVRMIRPFDDKYTLDFVFTEMKNAERVVESKKAKKEEPKKEEVPEIVEDAPKKTTRKKSAKTGA